MTKLKLQRAAALFTYGILLLAILKIREYVYYQFLRMWVTLIGGYFGFYNYKNQNWSIVFLLIVVLFNPIYLYT